jgi:hypothetical protein
MDIPNPKTMNVNEIREMIRILTDNLIENEAQQQQYQEEITHIEANDGEIKNIIIQQLRDKLLRRTNVSFDEIFEQYHIRSPKLRNDLMKEAYDYLDCNLPRLAEQVRLSVSELFAALIELLLFVLNNFIEYLKGKYGDAINSSYGKNIFLLINLLIVTILFMGDCINPHLQELLENIPYIGVIFKFIFCFRNQFYQLFKCQIYIRGLITIIDTFPFTKNFKDYIKKKLSEFMRSFASKADAAADNVGEKMAVTVAETHYNTCRSGPGFLRDIINAMVEGMGFGRVREVQEISDISSDDGSIKSIKTIISTTSTSVYSDTPLMRLLHISPTSSSIISVNTINKGKVYKKAHTNRVYKKPKTGRSVKTDSSVQSLYYTSQEYPTVDQMISNITSSTSSNSSECSAEIEDNDNPAYNDEVAEPMGSATGIAGIDSLKTPKFSLSQPLGTYGRKDPLARGPDPGPTSFSQDRMEIGGKRRTKRRKSKRNSRRLKRRSNRKRRRSSKR